MFEPNTPSLISRIDFEHNAYLLSEMMTNGRVSIGRNIRDGSKIAKGLLAVRKLPNGRINLLTINESPRCMMNSIPMMMTHKKDIENDK